MTLRLHGALNYSHGLSKGPSFGTGRDATDGLEESFCSGSPYRRARAASAGLRKFRQRLQDSVFRLSSNFRTRRERATSKLSVMTRLLWKHVR